MHIQAVTWFLAAVVLVSLTSDIFARPTMDDDDRDITMDGFSNLFYRAGNWRTFLSGSGGRNKQSPAARETGDASTPSQQRECRFSKGHEAGELWTA